ncbi:MAG: CDP-alcohol phosphatidyltransferase family protein [Alphaproteobacteria bacterium]|nr:CDP-alcohol phosphatidyltransferase family protein [Alphaproteobacteria bacterium]MBF0128677.1 CDP-alcohol phosphatidyltransferase family protein [Alphaproteobacteria bacterium]
MSHNTLIHRAARVLIKPLIHSPVSPNHLTTVRLLVGLGASAALAMGEMNLGAGLFVLSMVLDRADGELARLSGKGSPFGHKYDLIADGVCNTVLFMGLGIGLREGAFGFWSVPMGLLAGMAVASILWLVMRAEAREGERAAELGGGGAFDPDDGILAVPLAIWLGWETPLLAAAAVGATSFSLFFFWRFRNHL